MGAGSERERELRYAAEIGREGGRERIKDVVFGVWIYYYIFLGGGFYIVTIWKIKSWVASKRRIQTIRHKARLL